jgi:DNA (cytosine-5)-methyltransferase 1
MRTEKNMKILNLYAGIGGNRKLWGEEHQITAVENDENIACAYQTIFPKDRVIITDAHKYLLDHYKEFDFIWSSPPCPTHSDIRRCGVHHGQYPAKYPDMKLYEEIIFLKHFSKCPWVVENVVSYYDPLIKPFEAHRHYFWSSFIITKIKTTENRIHNDIVGSIPVYGFDLNKFDYIQDKRKVLRNMVDPKLGLHIFNCAFKEKQVTLQ